MACTRGTVGWRGHPAACATRESAPSAPTTTSACNSSVAGVLRAFDAHAQARPIALQRQEPVAERNLRAVALRLLRKAANQSRALDDQVGTIQRNMGACGRR